MIEWISGRCCGFADRECILCDLNMTKLERGRYRLLPEDKRRAENILNRSIEFERSGGVKPRLTAEHPDGSKTDFFMCCCFRLFVLFVAGFERSLSASWSEY